jgi:hypothetical protein
MPVIAVTRAKTVVGKAAYVLVFMESGLAMAFYVTLTR